MPSGPKRRKKAAAAAAKKKEEDEVGISTATPQQGIPSIKAPFALSLYSLIHLFTCLFALLALLKSLCPINLHKEMEEKGEMESSDNAKDVSIEAVKAEEEDPCVSERSHEVLLDKVEASEGAEAKEEVASVPDRPTEILLERVSEERVEEAKEEVGGESLGGGNFVVERSAEIVLQEVQSGEESVAHVTEEEGVEASEVPVSVPADSALSEGEGEESREMPHMGTVIMSSVIGSILSLNF